MMKIFVSKADPITRDKPVEDAEIHITKLCPKHKSPKEAEEFHAVQARDIHDALRHSLPQGTKHELLMLMLKDASNLYRGI